MVGALRRQPVLRWWCGGGRSPRRLDKTIAPHPKYAYLILVFFFLFAFTNCPSPFWPQVAQIKHPLATNRLLPACLLVVRLPPLSVLRRLAQVPPLSVLRRLMEPLALLRGLLFVVGRPPLQLGAAPLVWVDWRHHPVLGPARRERSTRRGCWPACLSSWSSSVRSSTLSGVHSKSESSTFSRVTRWDSSGRPHKRTSYVMTCWPSSRCGVSPLSQAAAA